MKKKSLFRKVLSLVCCVAMCLTTLVPVVDAATANAGTIVMNVPEGVVFYNDTGAQIGGTATNSGYGTNYDCTYENNEVTFKVPDGMTDLAFKYGTEIVFYAKVDGVLDVDVATGNYSGSVNPVEYNDSKNQFGGSNWKITVTLNRFIVSTGLNLNVSVSAYSYTVEFSADGNDYAIIGAKNDTNIYTGKTVEFVSDTEIKFKVNATDPAKNVEVWENGVTPVNCDNEGVYTYIVSGDVKLIVKLVDKKYTVSAPKANEAYDYVPNTSETVGYNGTFSFYVTPTKGYSAVSEVTAAYTDGTEGTVNVKKVGETLYTIVGIKGHVKITVTAGDKAKYPVNYTEGTGYTIGAEDTATDGTAYTFSVTPETGYNANVKITVGGKPFIVEPNIDETGKKTYTIDADKVTGDINITVTATRQSFAVTVDQTELKNGTTTARNTTAVYGSDYTFYVNPAEGYNAPTIKVTVDGKDANVTKLGNNQYAVTNITGIVNITIADSGAKTYKVTFRDGTGFDYTFEAGQTADNVNVEHGKTYNGKITLDPAYSNSDVVITANGTPVVATKDETNSLVYNYTIENVTAPQVVAVNTLTKNTYKVTLTPGTGYTLTAFGDTTVSYNDSFQFRLDTSAELSSAEVYIDNEKQTGVDGVYTISNITSDIKVTVKTTAQTFTATVSNDADDHATVNKTMGTADKIPYNGDYAFTVEVDNGYSIAKVSVNGSEVTAIDNVYTVHGIVRNITIVVETVENTLTVNYESIEKNHEYTKTVVYKYTELTTNAVFPALKECKLHTFTGWYEGDSKVESLSACQSKITNGNATIDLTAVFTVEEATIKELLKLQKTTGEVTNLANNSYRITFRTKVGVDSEKTDVCVSEFVKITKHGTVLANTESVDFENVKFDGTDVSKTGVYNGIESSDSEGNKVYFYFVSCGYSWEGFNTALIAEEAKNSIILRVNGVKETNTLNAAGWVEVKVGNETFLIISEASGVVTVPSAN